MLLILSIPASGIEPTPNPQHEQQNHLNVTVTKCLGVGANGIVFEGILRWPHQHGSAVAVKIGYHDPYAPNYEERVHFAMSMDGPRS